MIIQENLCRVCLKIFNDPRWLPCKHIYCFKCIPYLQCNDSNLKDQVVLECRICLRRHRFKEWSAVKYYVTLHCVPYLTALQFDKTINSIAKFSCPSCFNVMMQISNDELLKYCFHCKKNICQECFMEHRMELKKNILQRIDQCYGLIRRNQQDVEQTMNKLENMKLHIDFCAFEFNDQIDTYCASLRAQIDEQKSHEETDSSSGYESFTDQQTIENNHPPADHSLSIQKNMVLTESTVIPIRLLGELISSNSSQSILSTSQILWTMTCHFHPTYIVFELDSSKLFICTDCGDVSVYHYNASSLILSHRFHLQTKKTSISLVIKSLTASTFSLMVVFNSSVESILHFYSHTGHLLHNLLFSNEYINQIRFHHSNLWCLELISSSLFYFKLQSIDKINEQDFEKVQFISFKQMSFQPFRFALNQSFVAIMDRLPTGIILLYDKHTSEYLKQIKSPLNDLQACDFELTNHTLIYRFLHLILLIQLDNEQIREQIEATKNINLTKGKSADEFIISTFTNDHNIFIIQCFSK
ncbi:hypothetical protein I4U23_028495 [Adineta vaga]|nr:hypothetical protein I4U23_028495 [Adineta vaga]